MNTKVSVIIPIYNVEPYLRQCLDSVVNQSYKNLEIILIDDGSLDNCGAICDEYAAADERIVVVHKKNEGVSAARNMGIDMSHGNWLAFVDPDDWLELDYFERMIAEIQERHVDVFCSGGAFLEYRRQRQVRHRVRKNFCYFGEDYVKEREALLAKVLISKISDTVLENGMLFDMPWNNLYSTDFMKKHSLYFQLKMHPLEDTLLNYKIFDQAISVGGCRIIGYHYRQSNPLSVLKRFQADAFQQLCVFLRELAVYRAVSIQGQSEQVDDALAARSMNEFIRCMRNQFFHKDAALTRRQRVDALKAAKREPCFRRTYHRWSMRYFTKGSFLIKCALLMPGTWLIEVSNWLLQTVRRLKQKT